MALGYRVFVVLDRVYGKRLSALSQRGPVWIVDTTLNRAVALQTWAAHPNGSHLNGVTTFKASDDCSPEDALINELSTIDLHHGSDSADPAYTELEVIGTTISNKVKAELSQFGFNDFQATAEGFCAIRRLPSEVMIR